jgi:uncharacterized membrane protein
MKSFSMQLFILITESVLNRNKLVKLVLENIRIVKEYHPIKIDMTAALRF